MLKHLPYFALLIFLFGCNAANSNSGGSRSIDYDAFGDYWYQGKAELNSYALEQYRYGEKRDGEAVLIFVTEDFSKEKQVKLDDPQANERDAQKVLKLNLTKKFVTGIYPYSMMLSVFTPVYESIPSVKVTASVQEWCGQTYTQLNRQNGKYNVRLFSYFENESDQNLTIDAIPEDNLWTLLRLNPNQVPTGEVRLIPGLLDQRLTHEQLEAEDANISISEAENTMADFNASGLKVLTVKYKSYPRTLRIFYTAAFPYEVAGWEEVRELKNGQQEVSRATRKAKMITDYWTKNRTEFEPLRNELQLK
ncbi:hypothetical protein POKO110462_14305 [Pontibacter korlensis]|uniref:Septum formation inhibitor Maf n=1 Tax=Pontibacter korlensis TaxID=400092 RepID=A0A0E3ZGV7_9BACT|nr:hypothetical protein [Pontibacter korlensis]AKD05145.1 hypothetical protein PKOR_21285 [Pontibacter korlensis]